MPNETKVIVKIKNDRVQKAPRRRGRPGVRYGPYSPAEDDPRPSLNTNMVFLDSSMQFQSVVDDSEVRRRYGAFIDPPYPNGILAYVPRVNDLYVSQLDSNGILSLASAYKNAAFFRTTNVRVPPVTGDVYRLVDRSMPLPARDLDPLDLTVKLGSRTFQLSKLAKPSLATARLAAAQAADPQDPVLIANLEKEVHESDYPTGESICRPDMVPNFWYTHKDHDQRDLLRDYGILRERLPFGKYRIKIECPRHFEPFDVHDTTNFKVTRRLDENGDPATFDSEGVDPSGLPRHSVTAGTRRTKVWLVPQPWKFVITYTQHIADVWRDISSPLQPQTRTFWTRLVTDSGVAPAFCSPMVPNGWETPGNFGNPTHFTNFPSSLHAVSDTAYEIGNNSEASLLRFLMQLSMFQARALFFAPHLLPPTSEGPMSGPPSEPGNWQFTHRLLTAQSDGTTKVTQEGAPVGFLVGGIEVGNNDDQRFMVWRKTARQPLNDGGEEISEFTVFEDKYDDPGYNSELAPIGFNSHNSFLKVTSASFTPPSTYAPNRFPWVTGSTCPEDVVLVFGIPVEQWPYFMVPRWID